MLVRGFVRQLDGSRLTVDPNQRAFRRRCGSFIDYGGGKATDLPKSYLKGFVPLELSKRIGSEKGQKAIGQRPAEHSGGGLNGP